MRGDRTVATRLRRARRRAGLSQEKLCVAAGIEGSTVSARMSGYEAGKHTPAPSILERLADALRIPVPYSYVKDDMLTELIFDIGQLSGEGRERVIEVTKRLAKSEQLKK